MVSGNPTPPEPPEPPNVADMLRALCERQRALIHRLTHELDEAKTDALRAHQMALANSHERKAKLLAILEDVKVAKAASEKVTKQRDIVYQELRELHDVCVQYLAHDDSDATFHALCKKCVEAGELITIVEQAKTK